MERVNRIAFVDTSNFNGSRAFVLISSNFCSISSNRSLSGDVSFRSVGEKRNELPDFFPKAHVMEQVNRIVFVSSSIFNGSRAPVRFFSNYLSISSSGMRSENVLPFPDTLDTDTSPLWNSAISFTIARPRPLLPFSPREGSSCQNLCHILS